MTFSRFPYAALLVQGDEDRMALAVEFVAAGSHEVIVSGIPHMGIHDDDALTIAHDAVFEAARTFDESRSSFVSYAGRRIRSRLADEYRKRAAAKTVSIDKVEISVETDDPAYMTPDDDEDEALLSARIQKLPPNDQVFLSVVRARGMTQARAAEAFGISQQAVSKRIRVILKKLEIEPRLAVVKRPTRTDR